MIFGGGRKRLPGAGGSRGGIARAYKNPSGTYYRRLNGRTENDERRGTEFRALGRAALRIPYPGDTPMDRSGRARAPRCTATSSVNTRAFGDGAVTDGSGATDLYSKTYTTTGFTTNAFTGTRASLRGGRCSSYT